MSSALGDELRNGVTYRMVRLVEMDGETFVDERAAYAKRARMTLIRKINADCPVEGAAERADVVEWMTRNAAMIADILYFSQHGRTIDEDMEDSR